MATSLSALDKPAEDATPIFELFRGVYATQLLTAAVAHFQLFEKLAAGAKNEADLQGELGLERRPFRVLTTALAAMKLLDYREGKWSLTGLSRQHLLPSAPFAVAGYVGLAADAPEVKEMVERLRTNKPAGAEEGAAFIFGEGIESAMERDASARWLTLALAGRAKNVAPYLATAIDLSSAKHLVDVGGGTGIYAIACLQKFEGLRATVFDSPEVLKVAKEMAQAYGVEDRLTLVAGDMFSDPLPQGDVYLLSNILHDWDEPECLFLCQKIAGVLPVGGRLLIHDVFLQDDLQGPLPISLYSAALFTLTQGRAYSQKEYRDWLQTAGLTSVPAVPTHIHCGVIVGKKA
ncbi:MAG: methyltransferase [Planctomycetaceae bacterium]